VDRLQCFRAGIYFFRGEEAALEFLTGYLLEKALSVDNIFVFIMIFAYFRVPAVYQHKVLFSRRPPIHHAAARRSVDGRNDRRRLRARFDSGDSRSPKISHQKEVVG